MICHATGTIGHEGEVLAVCDNASCNDDDNDTLAFSQRTDHYLFLMWGHGGCFVGWARLVGVDARMHTQTHT